MSRLRLLKANHDSQRYWLEDNIAQHYPAQIASLRSQAEGCRFDIQLHEQNRPKDKDEFSMKIGSITYTSRKDAGPALINICRSVEYSDLAVSIGE